MAHDYGAGNPQKKGRAETLPKVKIEKAEAAPVSTMNASLRQLAVRILEAARGGPEPVDDARAVKIASIVRDKFHGSFGPESAPFAEDGDLDAEQRAELSVLDGRIIAHRIVGRGRRRSHFWLFKPHGVAPGQTVVEMGQEAEA